MLDFKIIYLRVAGSLIFLIGMTWIIYYVLFPSRRAYQPEPTTVSDSDVDEEK